MVKCPLITRGHLDRIGSRQRDERLFYVHIMRSKRYLAFLLACFLSLLSGCGSHAAFKPPPIVLSVSLSQTIVTLAPNGTPTYVPVMVVAPTETVTLAINGLPAGISTTYKESESNPSGLLTLIASSVAKPGSSMPQITVSSSGQTASVSFTLVVSPPTS